MRQPFLPGVRRCPPAPDGTPCPEFGTLPLLFVAARSSHSTLSLADFVAPHIAALT